MDPTPAELVALVAGDVDGATLAARHGVSELEVGRWKTAYLDGMKAAAATRSPRRRFSPGWIIASLVIATAAFAQALTVFAPNSPAIAADVNANFANLKTWIEQKVGAVNTTTVTLTGPLNSSNTITTTGNITSNTLTPSAITPAYASYGTVGPGGAVITNDNNSFKALMLVGNNSAGGPRVVRLYDDVVINGALTLGGQIGYEMSCGEAAFNGSLSGYPFCCRMNTRDGSTTCSFAATAGGATYGAAVAYPGLGATTASRYHLSCVAGQPGANFPYCCRMDANTGVASCVQTGTYNFTGAPTNQAVGF